MRSWIKRFATMFNRCYASTKLQLRVKLKPLAKTATSQILQSKSFAAVVFIMAGRSKTQLPAGYVALPIGAGGLGFDSRAGQIRQSVTNRSPPL